jgi:hypothetical protein
MSFPGSPVPEPVTLTPREAFLVMTDYIWRYACRPPAAWDHFELSSASSMGPPFRQ